MSDDPKKSGFSLCEDSYRVYPEAWAVSLDENSILT